MINCAMALLGPVAEVIALVETVHALRPTPSGPEPITNDDQAEMMRPFASGAVGQLHFRRIATGRKMVMPA